MTSLLFLKICIQFSSIKKFVSYLCDLLKNQVDPIVGRYNI